MTTHSQFRYNSDSSGYGLSQDLPVWVQGVDGSFSEEDHTQFNSHFGNDFSVFNAATFDLGDGHLSDMGSDELLLGKTDTDFLVSGKTTGGSSDDDSVTNVHGDSDFSGEGVDGGDVDTGLEDDSQYGAVFFEEDSGDELIFDDSTQVDADSFVHDVNDNLLISTEGSDQFIPTSGGGAYDFEDTFMSGETPNFSLEHFDLEDRTNTLFQKINIQKIAGLEGAVPDYY